MTPRNGEPRIASVRQRKLAPLVKDQRPYCITRGDVVLRANLFRGRTSFRGELDHHITEVSFLPP